jgi:UDP-N-acetylmuramyl tripeptide synthase
MGTRELNDCASLPCIRAPCQGARQWQGQRSDAALTRSLQRMPISLYHRTDEVDFDVAVFTNLSSDNLHDGFGVGPAETLEEHLDIMAGLFRRLQDSDRQRAIINVDGKQ